MSSCNVSESSSLPLKQRWRLQSTAVHSLTNLQQDILIINNCINLPRIKKMHINFFSGNENIVSTIKKNCRNRVKIDIYNLHIHDVKTPVTLHLNEK